MVADADRQKAIIRNGNVYTILDYKDVLLESLMRLYASLDYERRKPVLDKPLTERTLTVIRGRGL